MPKVKIPGSMTKIMVRNTAAYTNQLLVPTLYAASLNMPHGPSRTPA